jgi:hypothetical protein
MTRLPLTVARWLVPVWGLLLAACLPLRPPARRVPKYDALAGQPARGHGRVVLDVVGKRCRVRMANTHRSVGRSIIRQTPEPDQRFVLCVTPCEIELTRGAHLLTFCEAAGLVVLVGPRPSVFRAAIARSAAPVVVQWEPQAPPVADTAVKRAR